MTTMVPITANMITTIGQLRESFAMSGFLRTLMRAALAWEAQESSPRLLHPHVGPLASDGYLLRRGRQRRRRAARARVSSPMPNSTIAMDSDIALVQSEHCTRQPGHGYVFGTTECGASGLVAEKAGQSIWCFTLRVRLRAFVPDQKFGDGARHVVHPTDLERGDRKALRWSDASTRDENSHCGGEKQGAGQTHAHSEMHMALATRCKGTQRVIEAGRFYGAN